MTKENPKSVVYYKVVKKNLTSLVITDSRLRVKYKIGKFVSSPYNLPLAVCDDINKAKIWAGSYGGRIFICEIKGEMKKYWLPSTYWSFDQWQFAAPIINSMKHHKKYSHLVKYSLPDHTITCKSVKLVKEIKMKLY